MLKRVIILASAAVVAAAIIGCSKTEQISGPVSSEQALFSAADLGAVSFLGSEHLDLTPEQKQQLEAAMRKYDQAVRALMEKVKSGSISREDAKAQLEALQKQLEEEIKSILTPEQYEQWKQHQQLAQQNGGLPYPLPFPLEHLARLLELTPDQVQQAKALVEQAQKEIRAAVESIKDPSNLRKAIEDILKRADAQFRSLLTPEQAAKYDQLKKGPRPPQLPYPLPAPLEHLARLLSLSPDQVRQAAAIVEQAQKDLHAALETIKDPAALKQAVEEILRRADEQFRSILTPEQAAKYEAFKRGSNQPKFPYPLPFPLEVLARELQLSPEQVQSAMHIVEDAGNALRRAFDTISDPNQLRGVVSEILKRADEQFRSLLTPEQAAKYEEMKKKRSGGG
jgi:Spy/CpxP family protein refolding chaperone